MLALLCSTMAWASLPAIGSGAGEDPQQWQAFGADQISSGPATRAGEAIAFASQEADVAAAEVAQAEAPAQAPLSGPVRISGRSDDGLYWSLREAGAAPDVAAAYLAALATRIDVGEIGLSDDFDLILSKKGELLYAGLTRFGEGPMQLVKWTANGRSQWIDAANVENPVPTQSGMLMPVSGRITSYFGNRIHPILGFSRFHAGLDIGAGWGSPIVAAADGEVIGAGWAGGYGRQVQIAHSGGLVSSYSHMSAIEAEPGTFIRAGEVVGYVGSSGLSTGPHLHFEVRQGGTPVNPFTVRLATARVVDRHVAAAVKARLAALLKAAPKPA